MPLRLAHPVVKSLETFRGESDRRRGGEVQVAAVEEIEEGVL